MKTYKLKDGGILSYDGANAVVSGTNDEHQILLDSAVLRAFQDGYFDADGAVFFQRQLEFIKAKSYDVLYAELKARQVFPVSMEAGPGVTSITYRTYDQAGAAKSHEAQRCYQLAITRFAQHCPNNHEPPRD